jgi:ParB-like chromosome segregation protein Spo0J
MAVQWNAKCTRTSEYRFYPEDIKIKPELNGRHELPDVECLIEDITRNGQISPVTVRNDGGTPVLVAGFSRWRAVSEINKRKLLPVKLQMRCTYVQCSEMEGFVANIAENRFRNGTSLLDDAHNIAKLIHKWNLTEQQVAAIYFPDAAKDETVGKEALRFVKKRLGLATLTPEAEAAILNGRLKETAASAIAKLDAENQRAVIAKSKGGAVKGSTVAAAGDKKTRRSIKEQIREVIESGTFKLGKVEHTADQTVIDWLSSLLSS